MVIPVYMVLVVYCTLPLLVVHVGFWSLFQTVAACNVAPTSWAVYLVQHDWLFMTLALLLDGAIFWTTGHCLFIFDRLNRSESLLLARPGWATLLGGLLGALYSVVLIGFLAWYYPLEPAAQALRHVAGAAAGWTMFGLLQGIVAAWTLRLGLAQEQPTAHMEPPPAELIAGEMPVPIR